MPSAPPFSQPSSSHSPFPALYLYPLNDSFIPKHISLAHGQRVKIGRQTNAKTAPGERNGFFDSKVLSRQHAEVWEEGGRIFIKDVKSSNGTFINGERLSPEAEESKPWELKSDDIVEFGIDIVGEDNKTIIHHKVAARVVCVFNEQDAQVAARAEQHAHYSSQSQSPASSSNVPGGFNFAPGPQQQQQQRRQPMQAALSGMGGMGGSMRPPGKSGLTFDHILSRLQGELQKSRETGAELNTLTSTMGDIHETLGGALPNTLPPYPSTLPPVRPPQAPSPPQQQSNNTSPQPAPSAPSTALLAELQSQLASTQTNLAAHVEKIRALEGMLAEQEVIKREMRVLREMVEIRKEREERKGKRRYDHEDEQEDESDDDDARSVSTVMPHELERVDEVDEEQEEVEPPPPHHEQTSSERTTEHGREEEQEPETEEQEHARRRDEAESAGRPHTPEPTNLGMTIRTSSTASTGGRGSPLSQVISAGDDERLSTLHDTVASLSSQVSSIMSLTSTLEAQHTAAQETIRSLEGKVESLELVLREVRAEQTRVADAEESRLRIDEERKSQLEAQALSNAQEKESLTTLITSWKKSVEGQWSSVREEWAQERERLSKAREEWELKTKAVDVGMEKMSRFVEEQTHAREMHGLGNGDARMHSGNGHGLVTPPSPRSQSSDSGRYRRRRKNTSSKSRSRGRSRSRSPVVGEDEHLLDTDTDTTLASEDNAKSGGAIHGGKEKEKGLSIPERSLVTPEPSLYTDTVTSGEDDAQSVGAEKISVSRAVDTNGISFQTAFGVLVLSAAAAAVLWRVKQE